MPFDLDASRRTDAAARREYMDIIEPLMGMSANSHYVDFGTPEQPDRRLIRPEPWQSLPQRFTPAGMTSANFANFLDLSGELKNKIYEYMVDELDVDQPVFWNDVLYEKLNILRTCRTVRQEMMSMLRGRLDVYVSVDAASMGRLKAFVNSSCDGFCALPKSVTFVMRDQKSYRLRSDAAARVQGDTMVNMRIYPDIKAGTLQTEIGYEEVYYDDDGVLQVGGRNVIWFMAPAYALQHDINIILRRVKGVALSRADMCLLAEVLNMQMDMNKVRDKEGKGAGIRRLDRLLGSKCSRR